MNTVPVVHFTIAGEDASTLQGKAVGRFGIVIDFGLRPVGLGVGELLGDQTIADMEDVEAAPATLGSFPVEATKPADEDTA